MTTAAVAWHDAEHGAYDADLPLWRELAEATGGPVLDIGAGTGRVAIDLAAHGHEVVALDSDPELLATLADRAPELTTVTADARDFDLGATFPLVLAPMQLMQILGGRDARVAMLNRVHAHLTVGGTFAAAVANPYEALSGADPEPPLPDMLERDGWVFSSQPVSVREKNGRVLVTRHRQAVSPAGDLTEDVVEIALDVVDVEMVEREGAPPPHTPVEWRVIAETPDHIGSTVVVCRR